MNTISLLFPRVRAEVLRLLFSSPEKELHLRDLTRLSGLALSTMQKELMQLEAGGLVTSRRDGNRLYFRANAAHPLYPELHGLTQKTAGVSAQLEEALSGLKGIRFALIFGSQAAGTAKATSDIDLLVIGDIGLRALAPKLRPLGESLAREINPYTLSIDSFIQKKKAGDAFISSVINGKKLFLKGSSDEFEKLG